MTKVQEAIDAAVEKAVEVREKELQDQFDQKLKDFSKDVIAPVVDARETEASKEKSATKAFFEALSTNDAAKIAESNKAQTELYAAKGLDWRTDEETRQKAQTVGTIGTTASGGVLVPVTLRQQIIERLYYISPMRQIMTFVNDMPASWDLPFDVALPTVSWVAEGNAIPESQATFGKKNLTPKKLAGLDSFTSESLADVASSPDLMNLVQDRFATAIGLGENAAFVNGTGAGQPFGFRSGDITPTTLATNSAAGNLAYADVVQQFFTLPTAYRSQAVWVTSSTGVQLLDGIKDSSGRPIFLPGYGGVAGENLVPPTVFGRPLYIVDEVPTNLGTGTNETQLWFGVFKNYAGGARGGLRMELGTNGNDFGNDKISWRIIERLDARPFIDNSFTVKNIK